MAISRFRTSDLSTGVDKYSSMDGGLPTRMAAPTATDGGTGTTVSVAFTTQTGATSYTVLSTPGSFTATGSSSPVVVSGLSSGTAYTFQVSATNSQGTGPYSAASNSVTPATPSSFESIATATPSGTNTVSFTSIPSTYKHLQIRISALTSSGGGSFRGTLNGDTSSANYIGHYLDGLGSSVIAGANSGVGWMSFGMTYGGMVTTYPNVTIIDIIDYASTTKNKTVRSFAGADNNASGGSVDLVSGLWMSTAAVNRVDIVTGSGQYQTGSVVSLYGIKGA